VARPICVVCGGPRIPIKGWPPNLKIHPMCLPDGHVVWTRAEMAAWLAEREQNTPDPPPTSAVGARGDR
jgi:hypothetical protein